MYPLSSAEFMSVYPGSRYDGWNEYMLYGGLPLIFSFNKPEDKISFLKALFKETCISDIIGRHRIRNRAELDEILNILSSAIGSLTNPIKLSATFKSVKNKAINVTTIRNYIDYLCDSFLIDITERYDVKGKKYIGSPVKYYFTDMGLRNARLNFRQLEETHTMENIIFNELKLRGFNVDVSIVTQHSHNENGSGILFLSLSILLSCASLSSVVYADDVEESDEMAYDAEVNNFEEPEEALDDGASAIKLLNTKTYYIEENFVIPADVTLVGAASSRASSIMQLSEIPIGRLTGDEIFSIHDFV